MSNQMHYLCKKLDEIKMLDEYLLFQEEKDKLLEDVYYNKLLSDIKNIDKKDEQYKEIKKELFYCEKNLRKREKIIKEYLEYIITAYNKLLNEKE